MLIEHGVGRYGKRISAQLITLRRDPGLRVNGWLKAAPSHPLSSSASAMIIRSSFAIMFALLNVLEARSEALDELVLPALDRVELLKSDAAGKLAGDILHSSIHRTGHSTRRKVFTRSLVRGIARALEMDFVDHRQGRYFPGFRVHRVLAAQRRRT